MDSLIGSPLSFMVAIDGSLSSHLAFQIAVESLRKPADSIMVTHIYNFEKESYLPFSMKSA